METGEKNKWLDNVLGEALGSKKSRPDFEKWQENHRGQVEMLTSLAGGNGAMSTGALSKTARIIKSRIAQLAAAAIIIVASVVILKSGGPIDGASVAWAAVSQRILEADTAIFDVKVGDAPAIRCIQGTKRLRQKLQEGIDSIVDYEAGKVLILDSNGKTGMFVDIAGLPEAPPNFLERLKAAVEKLKSSPDAVVESVGTKEIKGVRANGIRVRAGQGIDMTIWSDPASDLPLLVVIDKMLGQTRAEFSDFDFDAVIEESLLSMEVPEGYVLQEKARIDMDKPTEEDLVEALRIWATWMDGSFPARLDLGLLQQQGTAIDEKLRREGVPDAEQVKIGVQIVRGLAFVQKIKGDWHYHGESVKLGDGDTEIFRYRAKDADTYRVIYGDLNVKEVSADEVPK